MFLCVLTSPIIRHKISYDPKMPFQHSETFSLSTSPHLILFSSTIKMIPPVLNRSKWS
jgi:hypothetical protein